MSVITTSNFDAIKVWEDFNQKIHSLTLDREPAQNIEVLNNAQVTDEQKAAGEKIAAWWRRARSSGGFIRCNPAGAHPSEFHTLLGGKVIKKRLSYYQDAALLRELNTAPWQSERFRKPSSHHSALNLFAAGKISWQQKATLSLICETVQVFGDFEPIRVLNESGDDFSREAIDIIKPFLKYGPFHVQKPTFLPEDGYLNDEEKKRFIKLVLKLPLSEQYIFNFRNQYRDGSNKGVPSQDSEMRASHTRFLNRSGESYSGILLLSHGIRNAIGLSHYSIRDWFPVIPRLGEQTIDDVEYFLKRGARVCVSGESRELGLAEATMYLHGLHMNYPDNFAHDEYHSWIASQLGEHVMGALDKVIELARGVFGFRWSKDLWILRDGDLATIGSLSTFQNLIQKNTKIFEECLTGQYRPSIYGEIGNFVMERVPFLYGKDGFPNQLLLNLIIDLVKNPDDWIEFYISNDEGLYDDNFSSLIKMAKFLNSHGVFTENSKSNILQFDHFVRAQGPLKNGVTWIKWKAPDAIQGKLLAEMLDIAKTSGTYEAKVRNKAYFLGFEKTTLTQAEFSKKLVEACRKADTKELEELLQKHKHLLTYELFNTALSGVSDPAVAEVLFTKSGYNKFPLDASGKIVMPSSVSEPDDTFYQTENSLLKKQLSTMQQLIDVKDAYIATLQEKIESLSRKMQGK